MEADAIDHHRNPAGEIVARRGIDTGLIHNLDPQLTAFGGCMANPDLALELFTIIIP